MAGNTASIIETKHGSVLEKFELPEPGQIAGMWNGKTFVHMYAPEKSYLFDTKSRKVIELCPLGITIFPWREDFSRVGRYAIGSTAESQGDQ